MDVSKWICDLMRENYDAVGFIPNTTVRDRYVSLERYILQENEVGKPIGYLLHGSLKKNKPCVISQHCIDYDVRHKHYGTIAFQEFLRRCNYIGVSSIHLRVAEDLEAVKFWENMGFHAYLVIPGGKARDRMIVEMTLNLGYKQIDGN